MGKEPACSGVIIQSGLLGTIPITGVIVQGPELESKEASLWHQGPQLQRQAPGRMTATEVAVGVIFSLQTVLGVLGNSSLLSHYLFLYSTGLKLRCTDLIVKHLIVANLLTLVFRGVPHSVAAFGCQVSPGDVGCKLLFYLQRISRGGTIGSTCLLSVFQAISISPSVSRWAQLRVKAPKYADFCLCLFWALYGLINVIFLVSITGTRSKQNLTSFKYHGYCSSIRHNEITESFYAALLSFPDVLCVGLMLWTSSYMVSILHRHKQQMKYIRRTSGRPRASPESRATKSIVLLVVTYVCFYTVSCVVQVCMSFTYNPTWILVNTSVIISGCFPTVCPFLLMTHGASECKCCFIKIRNRKSPIYMRNG